MKGSKVFATFLLLLIIGRVSGQNWENSLKFGVSTQKGKEQDSFNALNCGLKSVKNKNFFEFGFQYDPNNKILNQFKVRYAPGITTKQFAGGTFINFGRAINSKFSVEFKLTYSKIYYYNRSSSRDEITTQINNTFLSCGLTYMPVKKYFISINSGWGNLGFEKFQYKDNGLVSYSESFRNKSEWTNCISVGYILSVKKNNNIQPNKTYQF